MIEWGGKPWCVVGTMLKDYSATIGLPISEHNEAATKAAMKLLKEHVATDLVFAVENYTKREFEAVQAMAFETGDTTLSHRQLSTDVTCLEMCRQLLGQLDRRASADSGSDDRDPELPVAC